MGGKTYNPIVIGSGQFRLGENYAEAHLTLARVTSTKLILGIRDLGKTPVQVRLPQPFRSLYFSYDPTVTQTEALQTLKKNFVTGLAGFEAIILARKNDAGGLLSVPLILGSEEYSLDGTFEALGDRTVELEDVGG